MHKKTLGLRWCLLSLLCALSLGVAAEPLAVQYRCDVVDPLTVAGSAAAGWLDAEKGEVPVGDAASVCWIRVAELPQMAGATGRSALSFSDLNVQRVDIEVFDATGAKLGQALRLGESEGALVSGMRATFQPDTSHKLPLYARFQPAKGTLPFPGLARNLKVEYVNAAQTLRQEQRDDLLNQSIGAFLFATAMIALFFGFALRDANYVIYAVYATLQSATIFTKSGLPYLLDVDSPLWLNAWVINYLVAVMSVWLSIRFGRFAAHSPRLCKVAYGVAAAFVLVIPLQYMSQYWGSMAIYVLVPVHFLTMMLGHWRGWRRGERGCGILLIGMTPIAIYWAAYVLYNVLLRTTMPSELALGSTFDYLRTLILPLAFCYGIADRTLRMQRESERLARFDALTGLATREGVRQFGQRLIDAGIQPCTLMINVERFRAINETLGPDLGDKILSETGRRLSRVCAAYPQTQAGRMHADQFCILIPGSASLGAIRHSLEQTFNPPAEVEGQAVDIALAVGVARPDQASAAQNMAQLLRNAEIALDAGRHINRNWTEYRVELESSQRADLDLLSELKRAVEHNELRMYLQPKVRLSDGQVASAEALVRWLNPRRGMVPPSEFVPFAEKTGRVTLLTRWMLGEAMRLAKARRDAGRPLQVSVNLSTLDLAESGFATRLAELAQRIGAEPGDIRLEVTESGAMQDPNAALEVMGAIRASGFSLSIDDFGTGYSSLSYLQKMPVTELKIDRSFVRDATAGSDRAALLDSTIALGHRLGLSVVAEGAETAEEWALLKSLGCDYVQGWYAAKPMPVEEFEQWCERNSPFQA